MCEFKAYNSELLWEKKDVLFYYSLSWEEPRPRTNVLCIIYTENIMIGGWKFSGTILVRSNKMQQYAGIYLLQNYSLHVSGAHRTHHQENIKL